MTIADAFKLAYENYEKAKSAKNSENSQFAKNDDKENSVEPKTLASNGNADIYATPTKAKASSGTPVIQITEDASSDDMKTTERKMKALVIHCFTIIHLY